MSGNSTAKTLAAEFLTKTLVRAETVILDLKFATRASVALPDSPYQLVFGKEEGRWGLFLQGDFDKPCLNIAQVSIETRVKIATQIPALVQELELRSVQQVQDIVQTSDTLDKYLDHIEGKRQ